MSKPELNEKQIAEINCYEEYRKIEEEFRTIFNIDKINGKKVIGYFLFKSSSRRTKVEGQWETETHNQPILLKFQGWYINDSIINELTVAICELIIPFQDIVKPASGITVELRYLTDQKLYEIFAHGWDTKTGSIPSHESYYGYVTKV